MGEGIRNTRRSNPTDTACARGGGAHGLMVCTGADNGITAARFARRRVF